MNEKPAFPCPEPAVPVDQLSRRELEAEYDRAREEANRGQQIRMNCAFLGHIGYAIDVHSEPWDVRAKRSCVKMAREWGLTDGVPASPR